MIAPGSPWSWLGAALPVLVALALREFVRRRRRVADALGDPALVRRISDEDLSAIPWRRVLPVLAAALALGVALLDPRWGEAEVRTEAGAGPVVLVLDASSSMLAADVEPNRLERQRSLVRSVVRALPGTAIGVVLFAGRAYALSPPSPDRGAVELYLDALDPQMVTQTGSSLAAAIRQGVGLIAAGEGEPAGALLLATDGDTREDPERVREAAALAGRAGIPVHVLGVGTPAGAPVPEVDPASGQERGYLREPSGEVAVSRLQPELLREIARLSGGEYVSAAAPDAPERLREALAMAIAGGPAAAGREREAPPRYAWFAAAALLLLVLEGLAGTRNTERAAGAAGGNRE